MVALMTSVEGAVVFHDPLLYIPKPDPVRSQAFRLNMEGVLTVINFSQSEGRSPIGWYNPYPLISRHFLNIPTKESYRQSHTLVRPANYPILLDLLGINTPVSFNE